ncbi:MAG: zinc ribbon domain-containing protein, partial [Verrucomicrobiia bacterium]
MLDHIEKLLLLQERDRQIAQLEAELADIDPHRRFALQTLEAAKSDLESLKSRVKKLESERNKLELEVKEKKQLIEKYSLQQFQTKKNPEYQALAHEIENCKRDISNIEDRELEVLEQIDATQKQVAAAAETLKQVTQRVEQQLATFA